MISALPAQRHPIYPQRYFDGSPTWFRWNKLTIADVYALKQEPGFEGQNVYFWLNHPIQYIRLVGLIVQIELVAYGRFCLVTLDDGSNASIEIKIEREKDDSTTPQPGFRAVTNVEGLQVYVKLGLPIIYLNEAPIQIGDVVRAHGVLTHFRGERQLQLKCLYRVKSTNEEAIHWKNISEWKESVLNHPWVLTSQQQRDIDDKARMDEMREIENVKDARRTRLKTEGRKKLQRQTREAARQEQEEKLNTGALLGSEYLPTFYH